MKRLLFGIAAALGLAAGVLAVIPQTAAVAPVMSVGARELQRQAESMPDECSDAVCQRDPKTGEAGLRGPVGFLDGGASCVCH